MIFSFRFSQGWRVPVTVLSTALIAGLFLATKSQADPTLVVDVDTGAMAIYVGDSGLSLAKPVVGCSWDAGGACPMTLVPGG